MTIKTKSKGKHPYKALSAAFVRSVKEVGFYADGNGLYLKVKSNGAKQWILRVKINGKRCDLGLGTPVNESLAEVRELAIDKKKYIKSGGDPIADKKKEKGVPTFEDAAKTVHAALLVTWKNKKQGQQWINTLTTYAFPFIGNKKVDQIDSDDLFELLSPIWNDKKETAKRVKQRIGVVFKWVIEKKWRVDNPAKVDFVLLKPRKKDDVKHHPSIPYDEVADAIQTVYDSGAEESTKLAMEFLILTGTRSSEVTEAIWDEIDIPNAVWTIAALRMKREKVHAVPLTQRCLEILEAAKELKGESKFIFKSNNDKAISDSTLSKLIRELGIKCVPHGFRTSFRTWASEQTNIPREVCEFALSHVVGNSVEQAYQRSDLFEKRRKLMDRWAQYLEPKNGSVVQLQAANNN